MEFVYREIRSEKDMEMAYEIYRSNEEYFQLVSGKLPEILDVINDKDACPPDFLPQKKRYGLYLLDDVSVAVVDVLEGFPGADTYYIGLFLINGNRHREGLGRALYEQLENQARSRGFQWMRLGVVDTNHKAGSFWQAMGFAKIKTVESTLHEGSGWIVEIMEKNLC